MLDVRIGHTALTWDVLAQPEKLADAIRDCAAVGYQGIETGGRVYDWWELERPGELQRMLADAGLPIVGLFQFGDWTDPDAALALLADAARWSNAVRALGGEILMLVPGPRHDDRPLGVDAFAQMAETMNRAGEIARAAGIQAAMHPHWGTAAESRLEIEVLLEGLDPVLVGFAPDTGQIAKGGADAGALIERWAARIRYVHLKDLSPRWDEMRRNGEPLRSPAGYAALGQGKIDFRPIFQSLDRVDYRGWLMAELDESEDPALVAATQSREYLDRTLGVWRD